MWGAKWQWGMFFFRHSRFPNTAYSLVIMTWYDMSIKKPKYEGTHLIPKQQRMEVPGSVEYAMDLSSMLIIFRRAHRAHNLCTPSCTGIEPCNIPGVSLPDLSRPAFAFAVTQPSIYQEKGNQALPRISQFWVQLIVAGISEPLPIISIAKRTNFREYAGSIVSLKKLVVAELVLHGTRMFLAVLRSGRHYSVS
jgi:hypothetical protein